jgi:hypothetical protein
MKTSEALNKSILFQQITLRNPSKIHRLPVAKQKTIKKIYIKVCIFLIEKKIEFSNYTLTL